MTASRSRFIPRVCYEIFVRSFCDSNGDGIGDLPGIISRLDYLADLGIEAIWLTPIHPSPSYHKYDVTDYYAIEPEYGTMDDFRRLLAEAHARGIHIYLDLIINHTSTLHPWFTEARKGAGSAYRDFYWWMTPARIEELGISRRETSDDSQVVYPWHDNPQDPEKYYGLFFKGMPDLNFHSAELRLELEKIVRFWLHDVGVDGFRLDAARHIFPDWEKDLSAQFWDYFARMIRSVRPEVFTVAEVWAENEEVAPYFRHLDATFHFDLSFQLQRIIIQERDDLLIERLLESYQLFARYNPLFIDATMLTNHDQDRIGSVVQNNQAKIRLAASILLTLPGQPYIYYGEEIGMLGTKPDLYIREPFLWSERDDEPGRTRWIRAQFTTSNTVVPLSVQQEDPQSVYHHYRSLIRLRKSEPALWQIFAPNLQRICLHDDQLLAYLRPHPEKALIVIHNLCRYPKAFRLPVHLELFTHIRFSTDAHTDNKLPAELAPFCTLVLSMNP